MPSRFDSSSGDGQNGCAEDARGEALGNRKGSAVYELRSDHGPSSAPWAYRSTDRTGGSYPPDRGSSPRGPTLFYTVAAEVVADTSRGCDPRVRGFESLRSPERAGSPTAPSLEHLSAALSSLSPGHRLWHPLLSTGSDFRSPIWAVQCGSRGAKESWGADTATKRVRRPLSPASEQLYAV